MKSSFSHFWLIVIFKIIAPLLNPINSFAQDADIVPVDSTQSVPKTIALADISIKSGEVFITTRKIVESLITDDKLKQLQHENDSILTQIDSLLVLDSKSDFTITNIRFLNNKLVFWYDQQNKEDNITSRLSGIVQDLDETKYELEDKIEVWNNTKLLIQKEESATSVINRIDELTFFMDSVNQLVISKSNLLLKILDRATEVSVKVDEHIDAIDNMIIEKKGQLFEQDQSSLFALGYGDVNQWEIGRHLRRFYSIEMKQYKSYISNHIPNLIFQIVLLLVLIVGFQIVKKRLQKRKLQGMSIYIKSLLQIFSRPISAALLLALFATILIFENRPPIFKEMAVLIATIPLITILLSVSKDEYKKYAWIFGLLVFIREAYFIFPPNSIIYRISLLAVGFIEILVILSLLRLFSKKPLKKKLLNNLVLGLLYVHLGFAFAGLVATVSGATMLSEITLNVTIANAFAGFLLIVSASIINGLIELTIDSKSLQRINVFRLHGTLIKKKITDIVNLGAIIYWVVIMMRSINIDRKVIDGLTSFFTKEWSIGSTSFSVGSVFIFFFVIWLSVVISKIIRTILEEDVLDNLNLAKGVPRTISVMIGYALVTLGVLLAVSAAGMPLTSLTILFGAFGVGIGFGLQNIFNNLVSGLILLFERPIQLDDTIEVGTLIGKVKSMGIRSSHVRTFDGAEVIVPNGQLISQEVVNWTLSDQQRRIEVIAGVAYGSDPHLVQKLFLKELENHPDILKEPAPSVFFQNLGESSLDFRLLFWTSNFSEWIRIRSDIIFKVHDILKENNISIPFPQRDLHLRSIDQSIEIKNKNN